MLTLHGFAFSNYHNIVKHALMHKGIPFEEHIVYPGTPELLAVNPAGKVPAMTTDEGASLAESSVMVDYLEDAYPATPLYPADAISRARVRQLMKVSELYLDLPSRRLLPAVLGNVAIDQATKDEVRMTLERGVRSLNALASFSPYVAGSEMSLADIYLRYALAIPKMVAPGQLEWDIVSDVDGLAAWDAMMADSDIARKIDADQRDNTTDFMAYIASRRQ
ncbi:MAG: glutathione S-transferase family protein [Halieaceae bacterium]|jgi:glutathione S-transferase|nr:glutathione S-transferase family protein [Halieaceae bacterium]